MNERIEQTINKIFEEVKFVKESMATKDELQAVKESTVATQNDLQAVKESMATKDELQINTNKILGKVLSIEDKLSGMLTKEEFEEKTNEIISIMDGFAKKVENVEIEQTSNIQAHDRFEERITKVEKQLDLKPIV
ncbi:MAG: hypothetical protein Q8Q23_03190 [bacterium]|nr:hypothetical protein [bacterium]